MKITSKSLITCLLALAVVFWLGEYAASGAQQTSQSIRIGLVGEIDPLDPNETVNQNTQVVVPQIFETLIVADESMRLKPLLATSWEVAPDGTSIVFNLRKGVKFHDGTPFNADSVKKSFDRIMSGKLKRRSVFVNFLKSVEIIRDDKVRVHLLSPSAPAALSALAIYGFIESPAAVKKYGKDVGLHPVGTGPFKFVEWLPDQRVSLESNAEYWGGKPKISRVVFSPVPDENTRAAMLEAGDLDVVLRLPYTVIDRLKLNAALKIEQHVSGTMFFVAFNAAKEPFNDKRIRQAVSYCIDRKGIIKTLLFGRVQLAETYAAPGVKYVTKYDIYPFHPGKGKQLLKSLGWTMGKSRFLEKEGKVFRSALLTPSGRYPMDREIAEAIQAQLKRVGIDLRIIVLESGAFVKAVMGNPEAKKNAEFGMILVSRPMGPDLDTAFYQHFDSNSVPPKGVNASIFLNKDFDRLLEEGARTFDESKRQALYEKAQNILNNEVPWLPVYSYIDFLGFRKGVSGVGYRNPFTSFYISPDAQVR